MSFPKITHPVFTFEVPSTSKQLKFRPMLGKEEKILLMAKQSQDGDTILSTIKQIVNNCCVDKIDVDDLALFDVEYLYLQIRAYSVNNVVEPVYIDNEDKKEYKLSIDLHEVNVKFPENVSTTIPVEGTDYIIHMKYPKAAIWDNKELIQSKELLFTLMVQSIDKIFQGDKAFTPDSTKEVEDFLNDLDSKTFNKISAFIENLPILYHRSTYKNSLGNEREVVYSSLADFFPLV